MQRNSLVHIKGALRKNAEASYDRALSMPGIFYTSPEFLELERAHLFSREWICLGRTEELEKPGDYLTATILEEPILLIRGDDGLIRAFSNVCRHRGMVIAEGTGSCRRLVCPYHHWTYDRI